MSSVDPSDDPQVQSILDMARQLSIDASSEFHLLPIALHALEAPVQLAGEGQSTPSDLEWFRNLVEGERKRAAESVNLNPPSPWLKLTGEAGRPYWFNFQTMRKSLHAPNSRTIGTSVPSGDPGLGMMRFTSWWTEKKGHSDRKRFIYVNYLLETEEFEVRLDDDDNTYRIKTLRGKAGPITCWDLHVGATIEVFGKSVTLRQCDNDTRQWLLANSSRLFQLKVGNTEQSLDPSFTNFYNLYFVE